MKTRVIIAAVLLIGLVKSDEELGKKCDSQYQCTAGHSSLRDQIECRDGVCQCTENVEIKYNHNLQPNCGGIWNAFSWILSDCSNEKCPENAECVRTGSRRSVCQCNEGFISVDKKCRNASYANVMERCYVKGSEEVITCNITEHSLCSEGLCICFEDYHPNTTSGKCEPLSNYLRSQNLTAYEGRPEEYCREDSSCISGLMCRSHKCQCPSPCTYKKEEEICDCGAIELPSLIGPIIVGIILGIIIMAFWVLMVKRTINKYAEKKAASFTNIERVSDTQENTGSYALSPVTPMAVSSPEHRPVTPNDFSSPIPPVGLSTPSKETEGQAPVSNDTLPYKPPGVDTFSGGPPPPPMASLYDINCPIAPSAPPSYSETPCATDIPPPHSLNPVQNDIAAPSLPYPANPENSLYPVSPSAVPFSSSASPGGAPSYPLNPYGTSPPPYPGNSYGTSADMSKKE